MLAALAGASSTSFASGPQNILGGPDCLLSLTLSKSLADAQGITEVERKMNAVSIMQKLIYKQW